MRYENITYHTINSAAWHKTIFSLYEKEFLGKKVNKIMSYSLVGHEIDEARLAELKEDYFTELSTQFTLANKKHILLTDCELYYFDQYDRVGLYCFYSQFINFLKSQNFTIYIFLGKELLEVDDSLQTVFRCFHTPLPFVDSVGFNAALAENGKDPGQFIQVDAYLKSTLETVATRLSQLSQDSLRDLTSESLADEQKKALSEGGYVLNLPLFIAESDLENVLKSAQFSPVKAIRIYYGKSIPRESVGSWVVDQRNDLTELKKHFSKIVTQLNTVFGARKPSKIIFDESLKMGNKFSIGDLENAISPVANLYQELAAFEGLGTPKFLYSRFKNLKNLKLINAANYVDARATINWALLTKLHVSIMDEKRITLTDKLQEHCDGDLKRLDTCIKSSNTPFNVAVFPNLSDFSLTDCRSDYSLENLERLSRLTNVSIDLEFCENIAQVINALKEMLNLQTLEVRSSYLSALFPLENFIHLQSATFIDCDVSNIIFPAGLEELSLLTFNAPPKIGHLKKLRKLSLLSVNLNSFDFSAISASVEEMKLDLSSGAFDFKGCIFSKLTKFTLSTQVHDVVIRDFNFYYFPNVRVLDIAQSQIGYFTDEIKGPPIIVHAVLNSDQCQAASFHHRFANLQSLEVTDSEYLPDILFRFVHLKFLKLNYSGQISSSIKLKLPPKLEILNCSHPSVSFWEFEFLQNHHGLVVIKNNQASLKTRRLIPNMAMSLQGESKAFSDEKAGNGDFLPTASHHGTQGSSQANPLLSFLSPKCAFDGETYSDPKQPSREVQFFYKLSSGGRVTPISSRDYRLVVLNRVEMDEKDGFSLLSSPDKDDCITPYFPGNVSYQKQVITRDEFKQSHAGDYYACISISHLLNLFPKHAYEWIPLPGLENADAKMTAIYLPPGTEKRFNHTKKQYIIKLSKDVAPDTYITYVLQPSKTAIALNKHTKQMLPPRISKIIYFLLNQDINKDLFPAHFIQLREKLAQERSPSVIWTLLVDYFLQENEKLNSPGVFRGFVNQALSSAPSYQAALAPLNLGSGGWMWVQSFIEAKGSCRHTAGLFYLLALANDLKNVFAIQRDGHLDIEYEEKGVSKRLDLGGAEVTELAPVEMALPTSRDAARETKGTKETKVVSPTDSNIYDSDLAGPARQDPSTVQESGKAEEKSEIETKAAITSPERDQKIQPLSPIEQQRLEAERRLMESIFVSTLQTKIDTCKSLADLPEMIENSPRLLIRTLNFEQSQKLFLALQHAEPCPDRQVSYLELVDDIQNGLIACPIKQGKVYKKKGALAVLIDAAPGQQYKKRILENADGFTRPQRNNNKSLIDDPAMIEGFAVDSSIQMICLASTATPLGEVFISRFDDVIVLPMHLCKALDDQPIAMVIQSEVKEGGIETKSPAAASIMPEINLFHGGVNWQEILGKTRFVANKPDFEPGILVKALMQGQSGLIIKNPPNQVEDAEAYQKWMNFWVKLQGFGGFEVKGEHYNIRKSYRIDAEGQRHSLPLPHSGFSLQVKHEPELKVSCISVEMAHRPKFFVMNEYYYSKFFQQTSTNAEAQVSSSAGWQQDCKDQDLLIFDEQLSAGKRACVLAFFQKNKREIHLSDTSKCIPAPTDARCIATGAHLIQTDDPDFVVQKLQSESKTEIPVHLVHDNMRFKDLIGRFVSNRAAPLSTDQAVFDLNLSMRYEIKPLLMDLLAGKTVILTGYLSFDCYKELETLFANPPYVLINGERIEIKGRLLLVVNPLLYETPFAKITGKIQSDQPDWAAYESKLLEEGFAKNLVHRFKLFYQLAQNIPHGTPGTPPKSLWNYYRIKKALQEILKQHRAGQDNPVKSWLLFDYDPYGEVYAYLNVCGKILFGPMEDKPAVRVEKLRKKQRENANIWQKLNCYNAAALRDVLGISREDVVFRPEKINNLFVKNLENQTLPDCKKEYLTKLESKQIPTIPQCTEKSEKHLKNLLSWLGHSPVVFLKGLPGTGKTHTADMLEKLFPHIKVFFGEKSKSDWIEAVDESTSQEKENYFIWFPDEANLNRPQGYWKGLSGLREDPPYIIHEQKRVALTKRHRVVAAGNPEHYGQQRDFHVSLHEAPIEFFKPWSEDEIESLISRQWPDKAIKKFVIKPIIQAFFRLEKLFPNLFPPGRLSLRDFQQLFDRYCLRYRQIDNSSVNVVQWLAYSVCRDQGIALLPNLHQRDLYQKSIQPLFPLTEAVNINLSASVAIINELKKTVYIPAGRQHEIFTLYEDLSLVTSAKTTRSLLLEGPSGVGKSTVLVKLLEALGYKKITPDMLKSLYQYYEANKEQKGVTIEKCFIPLAAGSAGNDTLATYANMLGVFVVFDEINEDPMPELFNDLLTGKTPDNRKPYFRGFSIAASMNPGLTRLPFDYENRFRKIYWMGYNHDQLMEMVSQALVSLGATSNQLKEFVLSYERIKQCYPDRVNARKFFQKLRALQNAKTINPTFSFFECFQWVKEQQEKGGGRIIPSAYKKLTIEDLVRLEEREVKSSPVVIESGPVESTSIPVLVLEPLESSEFPVAIGKVISEAEFNSEIKNLTQIYNAPKGQGLLEILPFPLAASTIVSMGLICLLSKTPDYVLTPRKLQVVKLVSTIVVDQFPNSGSAPTTEKLDDYINYLAQTSQTWERDDAIEEIVHLGWADVLQDAKDTSNLLTLINLKQPVPHSLGQQPRLFTSRAVKIRTATERLSSQFSAPAKKSEKTDDCSIM